MPGNHPSADTIAAISTPIGQAGIGIVRISGSRSQEIVKALFMPKKPIKDFESHRLYLGHLIDPSILHESSPLFYERRCSGD